MGSRDLEIIGEGLSLDEFGEIFVEAVGICHSSRAHDSHFYQPYNLRLQQSQRHKMSCDCECYERIAAIVMVNIIPLLES